jgi:hypothetical protein
MDQVKHYIALAQEVPKHKDLIFFTPGGKHSQLLLKNGVANRGPPLGANYTPWGPTTPPGANFTPRDQLRPQGPTSPPWGQLHPQEPTLHPGANFPKEQLKIGLCNCCRIVDGKTKKEHNHAFISSPTCVRSATVCNPGPKPCFFKEVAWGGERARVLSISFIFSFSPLYH